MPVPEEEQEGGWRSWFGLDKKEEATPPPAEPSSQPQPQQP
jgi:penicillin-binding protein 1B